MLEGQVCASGVILGGHGTGHVLVELVRGCITKSLVYICTSMNEKR
jgi:hypothetical protein